MCRNYHNSPTTQTRDRPPLDFAGDVAELVELYTLGQRVSVVEQTGSVAARNYQARPDVRFGFGHAASHIRGHSRWAIGAPRRTLVSTLDIDFSGWPRAHEIRVALGVQFIRERLGVTPVVSESPRRGHHAAFLWPAPINRELVQEALSRELAAWYEQHGEPWRYVEVRPTGQALRFPCGARQFLVEPDSLSRVAGTVTPGGRRRVQRILREFTHRLTSAQVSWKRLDKLLRTTGVEEESPASVSSSCTRTTSTASRKTSTLDVRSSDSSLDGSVRVLRGQAWRTEIKRLRNEGLVEVGARNTSLGRLVFQLHVIEGRDAADTTHVIQEWLREFSHVSNSRDIVSESLPEVTRWIDRYKEMSRTGHRSHPISTSNDISEIGYTDNKGTLLSLSARESSSATCSDPSSRPRRVGRLLDQSATHPLSALLTATRTDRSSSRSAASSTHVGESDSAVRRSPDRWSGEQWSEESTALLELLVSRNRTKMHLGGLFLWDVCGSYVGGVHRRRTISCKHRRLAVLARKELERAGVLRRLNGWHVKAHLTSYWDVDVRRARRLWLEAGNSVIWDEDPVTYHVARARWLETVLAVVAEPLEVNLEDESTSLLGCRAPP